MYASKETRRHFWVWSAMIRRCSDPKNPAYENYGGRGITVCAHWLKFRHFINDMGHRPTSKHTLERRDNSKNYDPDNCYWSERAAQNRNRRMFRTNKSGVCGVASARGRWRARIRVDGKGIHLGYFDTLEAATEARRVAMAKYDFATDHGEAA